MGSVEAVEAVSSAFRSGAGLVGGGIPVSWEAFGAASSGVIITFGAFGSVACNAVGVQESVSFIAGSANLFRSTSLALWVEQGLAEIGTGLLVICVCAGEA